MKKLFIFALFLLGTLGAYAETVKEQLTKQNYGLVYESYPEDNWELFVMKADGSGQKNITNSPDLHEMYPQVSPDGKHVACIVDTGEGRMTKRSVYVMKIDGSESRKVSDFARQPFWSPDSKTLGYLPQEFEKFNIVDYFTKGLMFFDLETGKSTPHPNAEKLHHLYNPSFAPNGKWIVSTVHAGMGFEHAIILFEAKGEKIINLEVKGCRPFVCADGKHVSWGETDNKVVVAKLDTDAEEPKIGERTLVVVDKVNKIYHTEVSPDGKFLAMSRGIPSEGDVSKPGTHQAACEMVGIYAKDWDIVAVPIGGEGMIDLQKADDKVMANLTGNGQSNKEAAWFTPAK